MDAACVCVFVVCRNFKNNICDVLGILIFPDVALTLTFVTGTSSMGPLSLRPSLPTQDNCTHAPPLSLPVVSVCVVDVSGILVSTFGAVMYTAAKFSAVKSSQPQHPSARGGGGTGKDDAPSSVSSTTRGLTDTSPLSHRPTAVGECVEANGRGDEDT